MTTALFDTATGESTATKTRPDRKTVQALEAFGYKADAVRNWTVERAETTLASCRLEQKIALRKADDVARTQEEHVARGQPTLMERQAAAECIEQAQSKGIEELSQCMSYAIYALSDDETKHLAAYLIGLMRALPAAAMAQTSDDSEIPE